MVKNADKSEKTYLAVKINQKVKIRLSFAMAEDEAAPVLTPEQIAEFRDVFNIFDKDGDGRVTVKELGTIMRALGHHPAAAELEVMVADVDTEGTQTVEFAEFLEMMAKQLQETGIEDDVKEAFAAFDKDKDGKITTAELIHILKNIGEPLPQEDIDEMIAEADVHKDGTIDYIEFIHRLLYT
jgi:calmodulin